MENLPDNAGLILLPLARHAIAHALGRPETPKIDQPPWLHMPGASFITLMQADRQRARTGTLEADKTLATDVRANAVKAAFNYPGCPPLRPEEFDAIAIEVAVLSDPERIEVNNEYEALSRLRTGADGVSFRFGNHSSMFLPEAWALYPAPDDFLAHLKYRAGLPPDFWDTDVDLRRYTVRSWRERRD